MNAGAPFPAAAVATKLFSGRMKAAAVAPDADVDDVPFRIDIEAFGGKITELPSGEREKQPPRESNSPELLVEDDCCTITAAAAFVASAAGCSVVRLPEHVSSVRDSV